jgi:hypothetical protein
MKTIMAIHGKTLRDKMRSDQLRQLSGIQYVIKWLMFEEKSGMVMWREWRTTVSQRSPEIIVHMECVAEGG